MKILSIFVALLENMNFNLLPLVEIVLTDLPKTGRVLAPPPSGSYGPVQCSLAHLRVSALLFGFFAIIKTGIHEDNFFC